MSRDRPIRDAVVEKDRRARMRFNWKHTNKSPVARFFMRIAASTYLNSAPLVYSFTQGLFQRKYAFIGDEAPSRCAEMLQAGQCDIALIPVIELQRIPDLRIIPEIAVASKKRVRSVLIASRRPLDEVRTLSLDP